MDGKTHCVDTCYHSFYNALTRGTGFQNSDTFIIPKCAKAEKLNRRPDNVRFKFCVYHPPSGKAKAFTSSSLSECVFFTTDTMSHPQAFTQFITHKYIQKDSITVIAKIRWYHLQSKWSIVPWIYESFEVMLLLAKYIDYWGGYGKRKIWSAHNERII